ncbi:MAG: hypothetical protein ACHQX3_06470 [Nitrospirales bacterium]
MEARKHIIRWIAYNGAMRSESFASERAMLKRIAFLTLKGHLAHVCAACAEYHEAKAGAK